MNCGNTLYLIFVFIFIDLMSAACLTLFSVKFQVHTDPVAANVAAHLYIHLHICFFSLHLSSILMKISIIPPYFNWHAIYTLYICVCVWRILDKMNLINFIWWTNLEDGKKTSVPCWTNMKTLISVTIMLFANSVT